MIVQIADWKFQIFEVATRKYYAQQKTDRCECAWCRNFYESVDAVYPNLRFFLNQFSVQVDVPEEMIAFTPTLCSGYYGVCGSIVSRGEEPLAVDGLAVEPQTVQEAMVNTGLEGPVFFLYVGCLSLPWVLQEPMEEAESPARKQNPIQRILERWITE